MFRYHDVFARDLGFYVSACFVFHVTPAAAGIFFAVSRIRFCGGKLLVYGGGRGVYIFCKGEGFVNDIVFGVTGGEKRPADVILRQFEIFAVHAVALADHAVYVLQFFIAFGAVICRKSVFCRCFGVLVESVDFFAQRLFERGELVFQRGDLRFKIVYGTALVVAVAASRSESDANGEC